MSDRRIRIDLSGPDGNAFVLLAYAKRIARAQGRTEEQVKALTDEMSASDYAGLLAVFERELGDVADLVRPDADDAS